jgi:hypothetical protein
MTRSTMTKLCMVAALAIVWGAITSHAFNPQPDPPGFGMVGITPDQTMRLSVANVGGCRQPNGLPPGPCRAQVELAFFDADGNVLKRDVRTIEAGRGVWFDCDGSVVLPRVDAVGLRTQVRPSVRVLADPPGGAVLNSTVEVFDSFGPDAGKSRFAVGVNHNQTLLRDE